MCKNGKSVNKRAVQTKISLNLKSENPTGMERNTTTGVQDI